MTDHAALDDEYRFFGDVGGVICDALEAAAHLHESQRAFVGGVGHHVGHQDSEDRIAHRVGSIFASEYRVRQFDVLHRESQHAVVEHADRGLTQDADV